jgi:hypothetical protein
LSTVTIEVTQDDLDDLLDLVKREIELVKAKPEEYENVKGVVGALRTLYNKLLAAYTFPLQMQQGRMDRHARVNVHAFHGEPPVVLCVRSPDTDNEFTVHGNVRILDIDLGRGFDVDNIKATERREVAEYVRSWRKEVRGLPRDHPIRRAVYDVIERVLDNTPKREG